MIKLCLFLDSILMDTSGHHTARTELFDQLVAFFPEHMSQPKGNLVDLIPLTWEHPHHPHHRLFLPPVIYQNFVFCLKIITDILSLHVNEDNINEMLFNEGARLNKNQLWYLVIFPPLDTLFIS